MTITLPDGSRFDPETGLVYEPPRIHLFEVSKSVAEVGETIVVRWHIDNADRIELNGRVVNERGEREFRAMEPMTFRLVARNALTTIEEIRSVALAAGPPVIFSFKSDPKVACGNRPIEFRWQVANATEVFFENTPVGPAEKRKLLIYRSREFRLKARNEFGEAERTIYVSVRNVKPTIHEFVATPKVCLVGEEIELSWRVQGAYQLYIDGVGDVTGKQRKRIKMTSEGERTFELLALNYFGKTDQAYVVVNVLSQTFWHKVQRLLAQLVDD